MKKGDKMEISEMAKHKILEYISGERELNHPYLRISVSAGGCSGLRYSLYLDDKIDKEDEIISDENVEIRIDKYSSPYLVGAKLDYIDTLNKIGFIIDNPNAKSSCACGDSFS